MDYETLKMRIVDLTSQRDAEKVFHRITRESLRALERDHDRLRQEFIRATYRRDNNSTSDRGFRQRLIELLNDNTESFSGGIRRDKQKKKRQDDFARHEEYMPLSLQLDKTVAAAKEGVISERQESSSKGSKLSDKQKISTRSRHTPSSLLTRDHTSRAEEITLPPELARKVESLKASLRKRKSNPVGSDPSLDKTVLPVPTAKDGVLANLGKRGAGNKQSKTLNPTENPSCDYTTIYGTWLGDICEEPDEQEEAHVNRIVSEPVTTESKSSVALSDDNF
ncbi:uncharacterized protein LOC131939218 [Physella acuta]|uniref:uncharacterized protein LOC131939218 n=1 Tax=Physella acuta TaxID=109671 RepID=UPI0027DD4B2E|nr:uncharacterized protein LOC131939218 [Physella acuta]